MSLPKEIDWAPKSRTIAPRRPNATRQLHPFETELRFAQDKIAYLFTLGGVGGSQSNVGIAVLLTTLVP
jgi:hypothetical protein